ncbi:MAG: hypothetical protein ABJC12_02175 [Saprospiraceae bacterium]
MNVREEILNITLPIYDNELDFLRLSGAAKEYKRFLTELASADLDQMKAKDSIVLDHGKAIGTYWAAMCIDDLLRTRQFMRGIDQAVEDKLKTESRILHILYAGTGPFAALVLPLLFKYQTEKIRYTFIEINPLSFELLHNVISKLKLDGVQINLICADATEYKIDLTNQPDIIISETMQAGLSSEPQVPIFLNLMKQAKEEVTFIPEKIELFIGLKKERIPAEELQIDDYVKFRKIFDLSKTAVSERITKTQAGKINFEQKKTIIELQDQKGFDSIYLLTEVQVYKEISLRTNESGVTMPKQIFSIPVTDHKPITIESRYSISTEPKLEYNIR